MDDLLRHVAELNGGFFTRAQALGCDWTDRELLVARKEGRILRLRHGAYAYAETHAALDETARHLVLARSCLFQQRGTVALTGLSAAACHGLALWGQDLATVHLLRLDSGSTRTEFGVRHHSTRDDLTTEVKEVDGVLAVSPARAAWEVASTSSLEPAVCTLDSLHRLYPDAEAELWDLARRSRYRPGSRTARLALRLADGRAETPGESLSRVLFCRNGISLPELQVTYRRGDGSVIGVVDFDWPDHHHVGEFDGKVKYSSLLREGQHPSDVVFQEKRREDEIRATGRGMTRWVWSDLMAAGSAAFLGRLRRDLERSAALFGPRRVTIV